MCGIIKSKPIQRKKVNTKMTARMLQYKGGFLSFHTNRTLAAPGKITSESGHVNISETCSPLKDMRTLVTKRFRHIVVAFLIGAICLVAHWAAAEPKRAPKGYALVWSDEFNGKNGSLPEASKWTYDIGGNGWGNRELEYYTNRAENARIEDGKLVITARQETYTAPDGAKFNYTSARLKTQGLFSQAYGRFEARIKLPAGQGIWPAFWLLGDNFESVGWPKCGEIDIMENVGKEPGTNHGSLHGPSSTKTTSDLTATTSLPAGRKLSDGFHVYAVEWDPETVRFYLDANLFATFTASQWPSGGTWVFDHPFFVILNVAVGGDWPGPPDRGTVFPQTMLVDYVRVYKRKT
jgi:beta-glucanase (GH16 family)